MASNFENKLRGFSTLPKMHFSGNTTLIKSEFKPVCTIQSNSRKKVLQKLIFKDDTDFATLSSLGQSL